jgi:hypothetical protein
MPTKTANLILLKFSNTQFHENLFLCPSAKRHRFLSFQVITPSKKDMEKVMA